MKILCIGRNYTRHVREMGDTADLPTEPVVFLKPTSALIHRGDDIVLPRQSSEVHHEAELVARIGARGKNIREEEALEHVDAYALGIDVTARDLQSDAKDSRRPWSIAKGFDTFAPVGAFTGADSVGDPQNLHFGLQVNGETRQEGWTGDMLFPVSSLVAFLSTVFTLEAGDLIFTGTPEGVGAIQEEDRLEVWGERLEPLSVSVVRKEKQTFANE